MDCQASRALLTIRACVAAGRYRLLTHCIERMDQRGLVWSDTPAVLDEPAGVRDGGADRFGRPKWLIRGAAADGERLELVGVLDRDARGTYTVFVTIN